MRRLPRYTILLFALVTWALFLLGCKPASVTVRTDPSGAEVSYNGHVIGVTPLEFTIQQPGMMLVKKEGFKETSFKVGFQEGGSFDYNLKLRRLPPSSYIETMDSTWASVEIRDDLTYEQAWTTVIDLLVKKFDVEILSKDDGYARTSWLYTWTGESRNDYKVRVTVKFSPDRKKVEVKSEAQYLIDTNWQPGTDTALLQTLKTDLMGSVGRTTR
jgi:hypothetical protein